MMDAFTPASQTTSSLGHALSDSSAACSSGARGIKRPALADNPGPPSPIAQSAAPASSPPPTAADKGKGKETPAVSAASVTDDGEPKPDPPPKKRRRRAALNCQECRRLKLKCDRNFPCDQCKKRGCGYSCPDGVRGKNEKIDIDTLQKRVRELEKQLQEKEEAATPAPAANATPPAPVVHVHAPTESALLFGGQSSSQQAQTLSNVPASGVASSPDDHSSGNGMSSTEEIEDERSFGTLIIGEGGRHKWIGPRAGSEWLQEGNGEDGINTPFPGAQEPGGTQGGNRLSRAFPFTEVPQSTLDEALTKVPLKADARVLIEAYFAYADFNYSPVRRQAFDEHVKTIYAAVAARRTQTAVGLHPHQLALFFQILATGSQHSLEIPDGDPVGDYYHGLAQCCLVIGRFLQKPTLAACQTLHIMGHYLLTVSPQSGGEKAWPIWGIAMRCCISMGLHRDGSKWGLEPAVNDERRLVFWETQTADILQSSCFSRPNTLQLGTYDTEFPIDEDAVEAGIEVGFSTLKFRLAKIINGMISQVMTISPPTSYAAVTRLWHTLFNFEKNLPFHWRCRPAWQALVSMSGGPDEALKLSPEINKLDLRLNFQRHTLASNIADAVMFLQRPYFTKALYERPDNPCLSRYASSFLAVFERCLVTIRVNQSMSSLYPALTLRQWFFWYHSFTAAVCMSTITILAPKSPFAAYALYELEGVIALFASAPEGSRPRATLPALLKFLERAQERMSKTLGAVEEGSLPTMASMFGAPPVNPDDAHQAQGEEDQDHLALLGWTTRLVQSLRGQKRRGISVSHLIHAPTCSSNSDVSPKTQLNDILAGEGSSGTQPISDDHLAALSQSMSRFGSGQGMDFMQADTGPHATLGLGGAFPLPTDFASAASLSPDPADPPFDYNSIAQFNGLMPPAQEADAGGLEWDNLAAQFMLGSSSAAPAPSVIGNSLLPY